MSAEKIFVYGASGHAKVVIDILEHRAECKVVFAADDAPAAKGQTLCNYPVIGGREALLARRAEVDGGIVTIGDNAARGTIAAWLHAEGFRLLTALHPAAALASRISVGDGTVIMAGAVVNSDSRLGANVIVNTGATIDHDCVIGDLVHIAPGCHLCGGVTVGARSFLGAGTVVIPGVRIGTGVVVGAGSTVIADIPDGARMAGSPAAPIMSKK